MERKLAAILSADAVGYTRLMADDDLATVRTITSCRELIGASVAAHRGRVVDAPGDNLLAELPSALDAIRCAAAIQEQLLGRNRELEAHRRMEFRIGVHLGDVMLDDGRIYGDGVNIASRLEGLADPGGVCVSATVYEQVQGRMEQGFDDLGERAIKNVPRPVRVYRLRVAGAPALPARSVDAASVRAADQRAIAVLPFDNLSADPAQEYLADAIAGDLIPLLSAWRAFPVIARNTSSTYKGRSIDLKQLGAELDVRYVVSGSVRAAGTRVRVTAELAEVSSGQTLWAQRYDRALDEIFALQDEVTEAIVSALQPALRMAEAERARRQAPESLEAWALVNRAWTELQREISSSAAQQAARDAAERALEMQPDYGLALAVRAFALSLLASAAPDEQRKELREDALATIRRATTGSPDDPQLWQLQGAVMGNLGRTPDAIRANERSLELDPNNAQARAGLGIALIFARRGPEGLPHIDRAVRLSPRDPLLYNWLAYRGLLLLTQNRAEEALVDARQAVERTPTPTGWMVLATALARLGRLDEARAAHAEFDRMTPGLTLKQLAGSVHALSSSDAEAERFLDVMRHAGFRD